ncbi:MAG: Hsp20/alpha crystallin family protein [Verrucomicrobiales bacterium]|nr:Hsp20/alpha crystallin family protein [Verrucomicrobiales bacterium]
MKLIRYSQPLVNQFGGLERLFRDPFEGLGSLGRLLDLRERLEGKLEAPLEAGLYEDDEHYYARVELPGFKKSEVKVELNDGTLLVECERKVVAEDGVERSGVVFRRAMSVPEGIQADKVGAKLEDGVLTITLPKAEERKAREIKVK